MVEPNRPSPRERRRAAEDAAIHRRRIDVALGGAGIVLLFASGIGTIVAPNLALVPFVVVEVVGLILIVFSFARLRGPTVALPRPPEK